MARGTVEKATAISDARIEFVSLVDKAANKRKFLITKAEGDNAEFTVSGRIIKTDAKNHYVTGIVYEPMTEDTDHNFMTEEEITKAAHIFLKSGKGVDLQHNFKKFDNASVVESWIAKAAFTIGDENVKAGSWLMTIEINDSDIWNKIEKGEITGLSMGGVGVYNEEDVELDKINNNVEKGSGGKKGLLKQMAEAFGMHIVEKGKVAELYENKSKESLFWNAFTALESTLKIYDPNTGCYTYESDEAKIRESLEDFSGIITSLLSSKDPIAEDIQKGEPISKAGKAISSKNKETLKGIYENLGSFLSTFEEEQEEPGDDENKEGKKVTKNEVEKIVEEAVKKAVHTAEPDITALPIEVVEKSAITLTQNDLDKMIEKSIAKAIKANEQPPKDEEVTPDNIEELIEKAVNKAMEPIFKSAGVPSNLNNSSGVSKSSENTHYLHGIL